MNGCAFGNGKARPCTDLARLAGRIAQGCAVHGDACIGHTVRTDHFGLSSAPTMVVLLDKAEQQIRDDELLAVG